MDATLRDALLREMRAKRDSLPPAEIELRSRIILVKIAALPEVAGATLVHCYLPHGSETDTRGFVSDLLDRGHRVCIPAHTQRGLELSEIESLAELAPGRSGRLEPIAGAIRPVKASEPEVAIVAGLVYGEDLTRLGDTAEPDLAYEHLLATLDCPKLAPVYDFQVTTRLRSFPGSARVDVIVGETIKLGSRD